MPCWLASQKEDIAPEGVQEWLQALDISGLRADSKCDVACGMNKESSQDGVTNRFEPFIRDDMIIS